MWFPKPIYERIPQFWFLLGLLFMTSGTYLSFDYALSFAYFGLGFACCAWSIWIVAKRFINRHSPQPLQHPRAQDSSENLGKSIESTA
jgi:hypothetical protein